MTQGRKVSYDNVKGAQFKIRGHEWDIEACNGGGWYRLGSWGANSWVYLTSIQGDLLKAVEYLLTTEKAELDYVEIDGETIK